jgi:drug/metabolite transporter (DMT)-like permease
MKSSNIKAACMIVLAMFLLTQHDSAAKLASEHTSVSQLLFVRGCIAIALFSVYLTVIKQPIFTKDVLNKHNLIRGLCEVGATSCFVYTLSKAPIALASTLLWISPFFMTLFAAMFLGEKVKALRWLAVIVGFSGMLFVTQPLGKAFQPVLWLTVGAAVFLAIRDLTTAKMPAQIHTAHVTFTATILVTLFSAVIAIPNWQPLGMTEIGLLTLSAILINASFLVHISAIRIGELSFVAPFTFSNIVFAVIMGYLVWGDVPNLMMVFGVCLIVAACTYLLKSNEAPSNKTN